MLPSHPPPAPRETAGLSVKLIDFGLARGEVDRRTDIYALGCLAYHVLSGEPPFVADTPIALAFRHCMDELRPLSVPCPDLPPALESAAQMKSALLAQPDILISRAA